MTRLRDAAKEPLCAAALLLPVVLFRRALTDGTFFFRDLHLFALPQRLKVAAALRAGALPFWDATLHGGQPLLANPNNTALYPTTLLYALLPGVAAFNVEIVLHASLAAVGAYLLARALELPAAAAFTAALVYGLSGPTLSLTNLLNRHLATAWTPFILLFWHLFLTRRKGGWFACAVGALALQLLAGFPELSLAVALVLAFWTAATRPPGERALARAGALGALLAAAGALAGPQLLPAARFLPSTVRGRGIGPESTLAWSVDPRRLPELAVPGLFGRVDALSEEAYRGRAIEDEGFPYVVSLTFGAGALALAAFGIRGAGALTPRLSGTLAGGAAVLVALSLGRHLPGARAFVEALPRLPLRYPEKLVAAAALPVALLAAAGVARLLAGGPGRRFARAAALFAALSAALLGAGAALEAFVPAFARAAARDVFALAPAEVPAGSVATSLLFAALAAVGVSLAAAAAFRGAPRLAAALACVSVAAPLLGSARELAPVAPRALFAEPAALPAVREAVGRGFLYRTRERGPIDVAGPSDDVVWLARYDVERLTKYTAAGYGVPVAFHLDFDGLVSARVASVTRLVEAAGWDKRAAILAAAGVTAVLSDAPVSGPGLAPVALAGAPSGLHLYRVEGARPAAWLDAAASGGVEELPADAAHRVFRVASPRAATLTLATPYADGWSARVDGRPARVGLANGYMQAVDVPVGAHTVELAYRPPGFAAGAALSGLAAAALAVAIARERRVSAGAS